jgi:hypothetical protein
MGWGDFNNVKVGDPVAVGRFGADGYDKFPVERVTATQFTVNGRRYSKSRGEIVGTHYGHSREKYVHPWTADTDRYNEEIVATAVRNKKITRIRSIDARSLTDAQLDAIIAILPEPTP